MASAVGLLHTAIGLQGRLNPAVRRAAQLISSGKIGRPLNARIVSSQYTFRHTGTKTLFVEHMNINYRIRTRLVQVLSSDLSSAQDVYSENGKLVYRAAVEAHVRELVDKYGFRLRLQMVLSHQEDKKQSATHVE